MLPHASLAGLDAGRPVLPPTSACILLTARAGGVLSFALYAPVQLLGPSGTQVAHSLEPPLGKTALHITNKRESIKSIILKAFEMQDARDQPAQPQALSVLQHLSTNCQHSARSQHAKRDIQSRNSPSSVTASFASPTPS